MWNNEGYQGFDITKFIVSSVKIVDVMRWVNQGTKKMRWKFVTLKSYGAPYTQNVDSRSGVCARPHTARVVKPLTHSRLCIWRHSVPNRSLKVISRSGSTVYFNSQPANSYITIFCQDTTSFSIYTAFCRNLDLDLQNFLNLNNLF